MEPQGEVRSSVPGQDLLVHHPGLRSGGISDPAEEDMKRGPNPSPIE